MNRRIFVLFLILVFPQVTFSHGQNIPRHIDPLFLETDNPNPVALFRLYSDIYHLITTSDYEKAEEILGSLEDLRAPEQTQRILQEYNGLLRNIIDDLNMTEINLLEAYNNLEWLKETEATDSLNEAAPLLYSANTSSNILESRSYTISNIFKSSPQVLLESQAELELFIEELEKKLLEGYNQIEEITSAKNEGLSDTTLQLEVDEKNPWVGSFVTIYGSLSDVSGATLPGKVIELLINGNIQNKKTDIQGSFQYQYKIPYEYNNKIEVKGTFWPSDKERKTYSPTFKSIILNPKFHKPRIEISALATVFPGVQYKIEGKIIHNGNPTPLEVSISAFNEIYNVLSTESGKFLCYLNVPDSAGTGVNKIIFNVKPSGLIGPGELRETIVVQKLPLSVEVNKPLLLVSGQQIRLTGTVFAHNKPLSKTEVNVSIGKDVYSTTTESNGRFSSTLPIEAMTPSKKQTYTITIRPIEPWIEAQTIKSDFWVLNSFTIAFTLAVIWTIKKNRRKVDTDEIHADGDLIPIMEEEFSLKEGYPGLYLRALIIIRKLTGEMITQSQTVREFLEKIRPKLILPLYGSFSELSLLYEKWLYGESKRRPIFTDSEVLVERMEENVE